MKKYKPYLTRVDLVKNQVERERIQEQEAAKKRKQRAQQQNRERWLRYQEQLRSELAARYFHGVVSAGGDADTFSNTKSLQFDGIDDEITVNVTNSGTQVSVSFWIKASITPIGGTQNIFGAGSFFRYFGLLGNDSRLFTYDSGAWKALTTGTIRDDQWHHCAVTFDKSTGEVKGYRDGNLEVTLTLTQVYTDLGFTYIGRYISAIRFLSGNLDEIAYWDSIIDATTVLSIYNQGVPDSLSTYSPLSWWRFEGTGATATDSGTGGNDGTINGATRDTDVPS